jgi:glycosyltransferase involved in cell wall biosynthesis
MSKDNKPSAKKIEILLIIPAYNEEQSLPKVIDEVKRLSFCDFIVVNDGSGDGTGALCAKNAYPYIDLPVNLGLAGALQSGMRYAKQNGYSYAVQIDADGQHLAEYVMPLLEEIKSGSDIAIGSRNLCGNKGAQSIRGFGSKLISAAIRATTGQKITDPTSGMRMFNKKMINILSESVNLGPEPDTIAYLIRNGAKISEVSVKMRERLAGKSYLTSLNALAYMLRMALSILIVQFVRKKIDIGKEGIE